MTDSNNFNKVTKHYTVSKNNLKPFIKLTDTDLLNIIGFTIGAKFTATFKRGEIVLTLNEEPKETKAPYLGLEQKRD